MIVSCVVVWWGFHVWISMLVELFAWTNKHTKSNKWGSSWSCGGQGKNCLSKICEESFTLSDVTGKWMSQEFASIRWIWRHFLGDLALTCIWEQLGTPSLETETKQQRQWEQWEGLFKFEFFVVASLSWEQRRDIAKSNVQGYFRDALRNDSSKHQLFMIQVTVVYYTGISCCCYRY